MDNEKDTQRKVSYRQKVVSKCPICAFEHNKEEMLTGGGRLIAGKLTDELRRLYEKNDKWGKVYPMAYMIQVCPNCLYAAYPKDFNDIGAEEIEKINKTTQARIASVKKFFGNLNFKEDRDLKLGAASYLLAVDCYSFRRKSLAPTFKNAISSIRAAWLFGDIAKEMPDKPYNKIADFFYRKAYGYYQEVLDLVQNGKEPMEAAGSMGPDTDKNWGYEGILYIVAILTLKVGGQEPDLVKKIELFEKTKRTLSKLFGSGKTSKSKPSVLVDMTRDLYDKLNQLLAEWTAQIAPEEAVEPPEEE